jgi:hydrogenase maturation protease
MDSLWQTCDAPPVLVLGLGNILLGDDGVGIALLAQVRELYSDVAEVECMDGGTQGLALLGHLSGRKALVLLDAFSEGRAPGEISVLAKAEILRIRSTQGTTAHEGNAGELLAAAQLIGDLPAQVFLIGVEPERLRTEIGLSPTVSAALPMALGCVQEIVDRAMAKIGTKTRLAVC